MIRLALALFLALYYLFLPLLAESMASMTLPAGGRLLVTCDGALYVARQTATSAALVCEADGPIVPTPTP